MLTWAHIVLVMVFYDRVFHLLNGYAAFLAPARGMRGNMESADVFHRVIAAIIATVLCFTSPDLIVNG